MPGSSANSANPHPKADLDDENENEEADVVSPPALEGGSFHNRAVEESLEEYDALGEEYTELIQQDGEFRSVSATTTAVALVDQRLHANEAHSVADTGLTAPSTAAKPPASSSSVAERVPQFHFSGQKAGMDSVDKARIERIVAEVSKGNPYYEHAAKADERVLRRAKELSALAEKLTPRDMSIVAADVNRKTQSMETQAKKYLNRTIACLDMDQFFVAVEVRDNPKLKGLPLAVGPTLISTASYEARKFGVRSAMPTFIARKLCPQLVVVNGRYEAYSEASKRAQSVLGEFDPHFSMMSLDEAFLDLTEKMNGLSLETPEGVARCEELLSEVRGGITKATGGLTCSAGAAATRMLAKICSERNKPNGHFVLPAKYEDMLTFVRALPVRKIPGIGKASELLLEAAFDVKTVADMWEKRLVISKLLTPALVDFYLRVPLCATEHSDSGDPRKRATLGSFFGFTGENAKNALEDSEADGDELSRKSISVERTFRAESDEAALMSRLKHISELLAKDMAEKRVMGRTLTLKVKSDIFEVRQRAESQRTQFSSAAAIFEIAARLLRMELPLRIRLLGIRASGLARLNGHGMDGAASGTSVQPHQQRMDAFVVPQFKLDSDEVILLDDGIAHSNVAESSTDSNLEAAKPAKRHRIAFEDDTNAKTCPICNVAFERIRCFSNDEINAHIDTCLNRQAVAELAQEVSSSPTIKSSGQNANLPTIERYFRSS